MRTLYAGYEEIFDDHLEAVRDKRRAKVSRQAIDLHIFVTRDKQYRVVGDLIISPWWSFRKAAGGPWRERLYGTPVKSPRPKRRKGKRSKTFYISGPRFPR
ncbi:hypothetical protein AS156_04050 [Bradyrhizobium macuxiense]|uniref:Uncharacterized protein n=1 Tax=Bradyrhizobium macuxiense TaxID=1755647 RepID=A0A109JX11_9BRAD|nr:hypothetical protein AS156_04050 [Bradyrhizobium macuxiense]